MYYGILNAHPRCQVGYQIDLHRCFAMLCQGQPAGEVRCQKAVRLIVSLPSFLVVCGDGQAGVYLVSSTPFSSTPVSVSIYVSH